MGRSVLLLALPLALGAAPAAAQDVETAEAVADTVHVTLADFEIQMPDTLAAGNYVLHIVNEGAAPHALEIERDGEHHRLEDPVAPGAAVRLEFALSPGLYTVYCPVGDHQEAHAMERALVVTARL